MVKKKINLKDVTIVIPAKIIENNLLKCLNVCNEKYPKTPKLVLLDRLEKKPVLKNVIFIKTGPVSIGKKRNIGVNNAKTSFIAFLDSDAYPDKNWLENATKLLKKDNVIAVGGTELDFPSQTFFEECVSKASKSFLVTVLNFRKNVKKEKYCDYLPSCNLILKKKSYIASGGMNTNLKTGEDWDFGERLKKSGKKILYSPNVKIFHKSRNLKNFFKQRLVYGEGVIDLIKNKRKIFYFLSLIFLFFVIFILTLPLIFIYPIWLKIYSNVLIFYFSIVIFESFRLSRKPVLFFGTFFTILIGNITPGIGTLIKILGFNLNTKKIYKNY